MAAAAKHAGVQRTDARLIHQRPAVIQELDWRPGSSYRAETARADPFQEAVLRFYNGQLFQIIVIYDPQRVEGMTEADIVESISRTYGAASRPNGKIAFRSNYGEFAPVIARWEDDDSSYDLVRTGDQASFALVFSGKRLGTLASAAIAEALRLDAQEAPQRAIDLQKKQEADGRIVLDKARAVNLPNFRP